MKGKGFKVAILDKNPFYQQLYSSFIKNNYKGAEIFPTETVEHTLELIEQGVVNLVLSDYFTADGTAMTLLRKMGERTQRVPVAVVTNPGNQQMADEILAEGAIGFVERGSENHKLGQAFGQAAFALQTQPTEQPLTPLQKKSALTRLAELVATPQPIAQKRIAVGEWYALLIAVSQYSDDNLLDLKAPPEDVELLSTVLKRDFIFNNVKCLMEQQASWDGIDEALSYYQQHGGANDSLLIFFAGHGLLEDKTSEGYWFPHDAVANRPATWYANHRLASLVAQMPMKHVLVIADCCFSGTLLSRHRNASVSEVIMNDNNLRDYFCFDSRWALTSTRKTPVDDVGLGKHSPFVEALFEGLKGEESFLTPEILAARIRENSNLKRLNQIPVCERLSHREENLGRFLFLRRS